MKGILGASKHAALLARAGDGRICRERRVHPTSDVSKYLWLAWAEIDEFEHLDDYEAARRDGKFRQRLGNSRAKENKTK